jgi:CHAD domain-containing protein
VAKTPEVIMPASKRVAEPGMKIRKYAWHEAERLCGGLAHAMERALERRDADSVHDLRVAIRRLNTCLRFFRGFFSGGRVKKARRSLKKTLDLASEVRNRDVALALLREAGLPPDSPVASELKTERERLEKRLFRRAARGVPLELP